MVRGALLLLAGLAACTNSGDRFGQPSCAVDNADVTVASAETRDQFLHLTLQYGGGCADHDIRLTYGNVALASDPPQIGLTIKHDAHGDTCDALLTKDLWFDVAPIDELAASPSGYAYLDVGSNRGERTTVLYMPPATLGPPPDATVHDIELDCEARQ